MASSGNCGYRRNRSLSLPLTLNSRTTSMPVEVLRCSLILKETRLKVSPVRLFRPSQIKCQPLSWKLVVPKNNRSQILIESHEAPEASHFISYHFISHIIGLQSHITGRGCMRTSPDSFVSLLHVNRINLNKLNRGV